MTAQIAGSVALLIAFTITALGQSAWDFTKTTDPLFAGVLIHPGSLANTIDYATASATRGDIESAISAFEQLRFYNPRLGATRFQLGVLYYQLGSYAEARGYLQSALGMPDVTPELRQKIEDLLELVDKKLQPDQFSGFAQTGLRYQSNASLGAGSQTVLASGGTLNNNFVARPDWNWFGTVGVDYVHDFQTQTGDTFEASAIAYDAQQFSLHQFDIGLLEIRAGPRFAISPGDIKGLTVKPYIVATGATLADAAYMGGIGGGLTLHAKAGNVSLDPYVEVVQQNFRNSSLVLSQYDQITITNAGGTITITRLGFMVTITNWNTPPGQPVQVTAAQVAQYIEYLSSKGNQNGGVPGLNSLATAGFACGTYSTPPCPQPPWLPTITGENDALQIIIESTQRATQPTPPPPPPIISGSAVRLP